MQFFSQMVTSYEDDNFFYFWKPHFFPSTFGREKSFLEYLLEKNLIPEFLKDYFGREKEYWLLNRLDNETAGLLVFAKNTIVYDDFKTLQKSHHIMKIYLADIVGNPRWEFCWINLPIMHRNDNDKKMLVVSSLEDLTYWRSSPIPCSTFVEKLFFDPQKNISTLNVVITKWVRHQIRAHLAHIWYPLVGDSLYGWIKNDFLHLWSMWIKS